MRLGICLACLLRAMPDARCTIDGEIAAGARAGTGGDGDGDGAGDAGAGGAGGASGGGAAACDDK